MNDKSLETIFFIILAIEKQLPYDVLSFTIQQELKHYNNQELKEKALTYLEKKGLFYGRNTALLLAFLNNLPD